MGALRWQAAALLALSLELFSLEEAPWLGDVYEFQLYTDFYYSQYSKINHAIEQPSFAYNNYVTEASIAMTPTPNLDVELEVNLARTPHQTYGFRSVALQVRCLLWDDIAGDLMSVNVGLNTRAVTGRAVEDVSSPYASYWNGEAAVSVGKEFTKDADWKTRGYAFGTVGLANHGSFWNRYKLAFESRFFDSHALEAFSTGYFGYGSQENVDIEHFKGWGFIRHRSIDVGGRYSYLFDFWGTLSVSYACRVWAHSYPEREQTIQLSYHLPFSLF